MPVSKMHIAAGGAGAAVGYAFAPMARDLVPSRNDLVRTGVVVAGGLGIAGGGYAFCAHEGAVGYAGAFGLGAGVGLAIGAVNDHFGFVE